MNDMIDVTRYFGIPYKHHGRSLAGLDCFGLVIIFYAECYNIEISDYVYVKNWDECGLNYIEEEYWKQFKKIDAPKRHCLVTFRAFGTQIERHIGIMMDDISFLHVPISGCVCIEKITSRVWSRQLGSFYILNEMGK